MRALAIALRLAAPLFFVVGVLHLTLGVGADVLLGAKLSAEAIDDPALDSQNRFYGVSSRFSTTDPQATALTIGVCNLLTRRRRLTYCWPNADRTR